MTITVILMTEYDNMDLNMLNNSKLMILSEVADYLRISERSVLRMVHKNEIPCVKIANQWRFIKSNIDDWLNLNTNINTNNNINNELEADLIPISRLLKEENTVIIKNTNKKNIFKQLIKPLVNDVIINPDDFIEKLLIRENMVSTGIGHGIAIPHIRNLKENPSEQVHLVLGINKEGVDFDAFDNNPTHLFFLLITKNETLHLRIISKICKLFLDNSLLKNLTKSENYNDVLQAIIRKEYEFYYENYQYIN